MVIKDITGVLQAKIPFATDHERNIQVSRSVDHSRFVFQIDKKQYAVDTQEIIDEVFKHHQAQKNGR